MMTQARTNADFEKRESEHLRACVLQLNRVYANERWQRHVVGTSEHSLTDCRGWNCMDGGVSKRTEMSRCQESVT